MSKQYDDDDGRTVINMDVDGMPWHDKRIRREQREQERRDPEERMTKSQTARFIWRSLLAGFTVVLVVGGGTVLFIFIEWIIWKIKTGH